MSENIMSQAFELLVVGMGFVFVFLTILVFATTFMSKLTTRFIPEPKPAPVPTPASPAKPAMDDATLMAVITAAVNKYRSQHKK
ncbi:MAG: OadG family protein [Hahellaceae bacterium]|nr:OadG family protein [Hahellaceae bacterium]MCP5213236.1 OadG family protein [Hahellaceae bacterium]